MFLPTHRLDACPNTCTHQRTLNRLLKSIFGCEIGISKLRVGVTIKDDLEEPSHACCAGVSCSWCGTWIPLPSVHTQLIGESVHDPWAGKSLPKTAQIADVKEPTCANGAWEYWKPSEYVLKEPVNEQNGSDEDVLIPAAV